MILKTDFRANGAGDLVDYIQRDRSRDAVQNVELRNPAGRTLSEAEVTEFVDKSRDLNFQRHLIVSPDPAGQYTPEEVNARTREFMNQEIGQQTTTKYVYAVHRDTEFPHAHVAVTGREPELEMDRAEIERLRERASTIYNEPERVREATSTGEEEAARTPSQRVHTDTREELHERELALEEHPEKELLRESEQSREQTPSPDAERDKHRSEAHYQEEEHSREPGLPEEPGQESEPEPDRESELERDMDWTIGGG